MKEKIKEHINNPEKLEQLYRDDRAGFKSGFEDLYTELDKSELAQYWKVRLDYNKMPDRIKKPSIIDIIVLISACLISCTTKNSMK